MKARGWGACSNPKKRARAGNQRESRYRRILIGSVSACEVHEYLQTFDSQLTLVSLGVTLLALENALVNRDDTRVVFARVVDRVGVTERRVRVEEVLGAGGERSPLGGRRNRTHELAHRRPSLLHLSRRASAVIKEN